MAVHAAAEHLAEAASKMIFGRCSYDYEVPYVLSPILWREKEDHVAVRLLTAWRHLQWTLRRNTPLAACPAAALPYILDIEGDQGRKACMDFLAEVDRSQTKLRVAGASRSYRQSFTANYRKFFVDESRQYRLDILASSTRQRGRHIWVNNEQHQLSEYTLRSGEQLLKVFQELGACIECTSHRGCSDESTINRRSRHSAMKPKTSLKVVLAKFDAVWAQYEQTYVEELLAIELKSRGLLLEAADEAMALNCISIASPPLPREAVPPQHRVVRDANMRELRQHENRLCRLLSRLLVAVDSNHARCNDLKPDTLEFVTQVLRDCEAERRRGGERSSSSKPARVLATHALDAFWDIRTYLIEAVSRIDLVDPQLSHNPGLVRRLVAWEESWRLAESYLRIPQIMAALRDLVGTLAECERKVPAFATLRATCDVELFLMLPRLLLLCYLRKPSLYQALLCTLLPDRFRDHGAQTPSPELVRLTQLYESAAQQLPTNAAENSWDALLRGAVGGFQQCGSDENALFGSTILRNAELMRELESWSMELQRSRPNDWNSFAAILVECLDDSPRSSTTPGAHEQISL